MSNAQTNLSMNHFHISPSMPPVLPRLQGDGMDSENLRRSPPLSTPLCPPTQQQQQQQRHTRKNLQPQSLTSTTYSKQPRRSNVPREPVKAAVKAVTAVKDEKPKHEYENSHRGQNEKSPLVQNEKSPRGQTEKSPRVQNEKSPRGQGQGKYVLSAPSPTAPEFERQPPSTKAQLIPTVYSHKEECVLTMEDGATEEQPGGEEERSVEGSMDSHLVQQIACLNEELDVQIKVNSDLKKLLVASVGDDLHHKVEAIVRTRAQLATDIHQIDKQRKEEYEDLDHMTIQADMWRSKYMASRVLVDSLQEERNEMSEKKELCMTALQQLMAERNQMSEDLVHTHRYVKLLRDAFDVRGLAGTVSVTVPNVLELARTVLHAAGAAKACLLPTVPIMATALDHGVVPLGLSPAERLAQQLLSGGESSLQESAATAAAARNYYRYHPSVRYDNITFDCCCKCKGDIQIV